MGRVKKQIRPDSTFTYEYDLAGAIGLIGSVTDNEGYSETYYYDDLDYPAVLSQVEHTIDVDGETLSSSTYNTYNAAGKIDTQTLSSGLMVQYQYNSKGHLRALVDANDTSHVLKEVTRVGVHGVERVHYGNGTYTETLYHHLSGDLKSVIHKKKNRSVFFGQTYWWDTSGNLQERGQNRISTHSADYTTEVFGYDDHDRLTNAYTLSPFGGARELQYGYDNLGNVISKSEYVDDIEVASLSDFEYGKASTHCDAAGPHAVNSVTIDGQILELCYDANGYLNEYLDADGNNKFIEYNSVGQPVKITVGDSSDDSSPIARDEFRYGPAGKRYFRRSTWMESGTQYEETTYYLSDGTELTYPRMHAENSYEKIYKSTLSDNVVFVRSEPYTGDSETYFQYLHKDHLGSIVAVTDDQIDAEAPVQEVGFDPFGNRRSTDWLGVMGSDIVESILNTPERKTTRGFTGHEHLDRTGFIHMNGRVYDSVIGRFLTPDPLVQAPTLSQSWNRYTYVWNNPMRRTDPSGFAGEEPEDGHYSQAEKDQRNSSGTSVSKASLKNGETVKEYTNGDIVVVEHSGTEKGYTDDEDGHADFGGMDSVGKFLNTYLKDSDCRIDGACQGGLSASSLQALGSSVSAAGFIIEDADPGKIGITNVSKKIKYSIMNWPGNRYVKMHSIGGVAKSAFTPLGVILETEGNVIAFLNGQSLGKTTLDQAIIGVGLRHPIMAAGYTLAPIVGPPVLDSAIKMGKKQDVPQRGFNSEVREHLKNVIFER